MNKLTEQQKLALKPFRDVLIQPCENCKSPEARKQLKHYGWGDDGCPECHGTKFAEIGDWIERDEVIKLLEAFDG